MSHVNIFNPLYARQALNCAISLGLVALWTICGLVPFAAGFGLWKLFAHYLAPVFVFASWLVITTFLHHQDEHVPWYADEKWDFVRGQLSSVDRDYGWAHSLVHNIGTHQIHHLFSVCTTFIHLLCRNHKCAHLRRELNFKVQNLGFLL